MNVLATDTCYCLALCYYMLKQYASSLKYITEVIERGIKDHPELSVGMQTEGVDIQSVGNSLVHVYTITCTCTYTHYKFVYNYTHLSCTCTYTCIMYLNLRNWSITCLNYIIMHYGW